eukprot:m.131596 g.131596  ORF g.131596 m.131596 type:complete len:121 (-) comp52368_c0_seq22:1616-1978(-)
MVLNLVCSSLFHHVEPRTVLILTRTSSMARPWLGAPPKTFAPLAALRFLDFWIWPGAFCAFCALSYSVLTCFPFQQGSFEESDPEIDDDPAEDLQEELDRTRRQTEAADAQDDELYPLAT